MVNAPVTTRDRAPRGAVVVGRDRRRRLVRVFGEGLRGGYEWFAEAPWSRALPGFDQAQDVTR